MTLRTHLLVLAVSASLGGAALAAEPPPASSNSPETDATLYGQSVTLPRQASACSERIADYLPRFQKIYDAWRSNNAARIENGGRVIREQAARGGVNADEGMARLADADVERLRKISLELLTRHCRLMLESLTPAGTD
jgi:hypothetical protein